MTPEPQRAAIDWLEHALRQELPREKFPDVQVHECAKIFDTIARHWSIPTEEAVEWIHQQAEPTAGAFKSYCVRRAVAERQSRLPRKPPQREEYPD